MKGLVTSLLIALAPVLMTACGQDVTLPSTGTIYGELVYDDGKPAGGIVVLVEGTGRRAVTDGWGRFVIGGVPAVDEAGMGRYHTVRGYGMRGSTSVGFLVDHFKVKGQQSYSIGTVTIRATGWITGTVLLDGMTDHSGVFVRLKGTSIETVTRADGSYLLEGVPAHEGYELPCSRAGFVDMTIHAIESGGEERPIRVDPGQVTNLGVALLLADP